MPGLKGGIFESRFSVVISGDNLPLDSFEKELDLVPTRMMRRGDPLKRGVPLLTAHDEWLYTVPTHDSVGPDSAVNDLLSHLLVHKDALKKLSETYEVKLRLYVQSDYAQMSFFLSPETMKNVIALDMPLEISSLSWGEVF